MRTTGPHGRLAVTGLIAAGLTMSAAACGSSSGPSATVLLQRAKTTFDNTTAFHLQLTSSNLPASGLELKSVTGDAVRPSSFTGTLELLLSGVVPEEVNVVSVGGSFYVKLPLASTYQTANPTQYGFADPGQLLNPATGISTLLPATENPSLGQQVRLNGELLQQVNGTLSGELIKAVLVDADPSQPVSVVYGINTSDNQVREVDLTGPIFQAGHNSTFTLVLTSYGEDVSVTPPAT